MDRIGPAGGSPTGTLTNGQQGFVGANLATGQVGTTVVAAWLSAVQEELMTVLAAADTTPNIGNFGQVLSSLEILFGGGGTVAGAGWQILPGGLIVQWMITNDVPATTKASFALPTTFPNNHFADFACYGDLITSAQPNALGAGPNGNGAVYLTNSNPSGGSDDGVYVLAIGN